MQMKIDLDSKLMGLCKLNFNHAVKPVKKGVTLQYP